MTKREDRIAMAQEVIDRLMIRVVNWRGPCHECKFWVAFHDSYQRERKTTIFDRCGNPVMIAQAFEPQRGFESNRVDCRDARSGRGLCGPDGEFFEPYNVPQNNPNPVTEKKRSFFKWLFDTLDRLIGL